MCSRLCPWTVNVGETWEPKPFYSYCGHIKKRKKKRISPSNAINSENIYHICMYHRKLYLYLHRILLHLTTNIYFHVTAYNR